MFSLEGKIAVITGGSSGIGKAAAERFIAAGATVVISSRRDATALADEIGATFIAADVCAEDQVSHLMDEAARLFGRINILINNAGSFSRSVPITERSSEEMLRAFQTNTLGPFYGMKHVLRHMPDGGVIINTSSIGGIAGIPEYADYAASKFATNGLTMGAALEFGPRNIRVNAICPTSVHTPMLLDQDSGAAETALTIATSALGRIIQPEEVAALMHFLAADDCPTLTGQLIRLDGGMSAGYSFGLIEAVIKAADLD